MHRGDLNEAHRQLTRAMRALLPACMVAIFGKRQRRRTLEELAR